MRRLTALRGSRPVTLAVSVLAMLLMLISLPGTAGASGGAPAAGHGGTYGSSDWTSWSYDATGSRSNAAEHTLTPANVSGLKLKWAFGHANVPGSYVGSQPAIVDGTLYVGSTDGTFHAMDAKTGVAKWTYDLSAVAGDPKVGKANPVRSSPAVSGSTVYFGDNRGYLYALNRYTGALRWSLHVDSHPSAQITGSPLIANGMVYIGVSSAESGWTTDLTYPCCTFRGSLIAVNAYTGQLVWRHWTGPQPQRSGSWPNGTPRYASSGVSVWSTPVLDRASQTLFVGTGQNYTGVGGEYDSVLAVNAFTGALRWSQQAPQPDTYTVACVTPGDEGYCDGATNGSSHDWDFGASANLFTAGNRQLIGIGRKNGTYYTFDRATGQPVWQAALSPNNNTPGGSSGFQWGTSYDGTRLYVATWMANPGTLYALDPATGAVIWKTPNPADGCTTGGAAQYPQYCVAALTPAVSSSPGLVYEGSGDGKMRVFSAATGQVLWQYDVIRDFTTVNGVPAKGKALSGGGGAVVVDGMLYVQADYYPDYPSDVGGALLAFSLS
jgi:polyvinyl alcohol dehydrogenase (cytochrome)